MQKFAAENVYHVLPSRCPYGHEQHEGVVILLNPKDRKYAGGMLEKLAGVASRRRQRSVKANHLMNHALRFQRFGMATGCPGSDLAVRSVANRTKNQIFSGYPVRGILS